MGDRQRNLRTGERRVSQLDPDSGRITDVPEENRLLAPFHGLWELFGDVLHRRMRKADFVFLIVVVMLIVRGGS